MQTTKTLLLCGLGAGLAFSAYSVLVKFIYIRQKDKGQSTPDKETTQKVTDQNKMLRTIKPGKPLRMWIDGKCFNIRKFKRKTKTKQKYTAGASTPDFTKQSISEEIEIEEAEYKNEIDVVTHEDGKLSLSFHLPAMYYIKLHQFTEFDVKHLSYKTQTSISWPKRGQNGKLTIHGHDRHKIEHAVNEIHSVIGAIREQARAAQFISIPIRNSEIRENFERFKTEILNGPAINGMHESIFQSPLKLHLTVIVFALWDDREKSEAIQALEEYKNNVLSPLLRKTGPLKMRVQGIDCMQTNYKKTNVLYANVNLLDETEEINLQNIVNDIADYFYERGLVLRHTENVKLHMTLINTKYRKDANNPSPSHKKWVKKEFFDASFIMEKYKDFSFGECDLDSIHLSLISSRGDDGFYKPLSIIDLKQ